MEHISEVMKRIPIVKKTREEMERIEQEEQRKDAAA